VGVKKKLDADEVLGLVIIVFAVAIVISSVVLYAAAVKFAWQFLFG
jgi:hypothetical protein